MPIRGCLRAWSWGAGSHLSHEGPAPACIPSPTPWAHSLGRSSYGAAGGPTGVVCAACIRLYRNWKISQANPDFWPLLKKAEHTGLSTIEGTQPPQCPRHSRSAFSPRCPPGGTEGTGLSGKGPQPRGVRQERGAKEASPGPLPVPSCLPGL